mgnify:CR=1 FL=1
MRVGLYFDLRDPRPGGIGWAAVHGRALELAEHADARGIDALWVTEHHFFDDGYLPQPLVFAAALAARTRRARIGTAVLIAPLRDAVTIAEEAAVVDVISGGRLELGLGAGYRVPEFRAFGADPGERFPLLEDRAREVRRLWAEGPVTPTPAQEEVPIWIGAHGPRGARLAGRVGAGLLTLDPRLLEPYAEALAAAGGRREDARMAGPLAWILCDDPERTWAAVRPHAERNWAAYDRYAREGREPDGGPTLPRVFDKVDGGRRPPVKALTVDDAVARLRALAEQAPVEHVFLWERVAGMPEEIAQRHVELVCSELLPRVRELP